MKLWRENIFQVDHDFCITFLVGKESIHIFAAALKKKKNIDLGIEGFGEAGFFDKEGRQAGGRKRVLIILPGTKEVLTLTSRLTPGGIKGREIRVGFGRCFFGFGITREDIPGLSREKRVL